MIDGAPPLGALLDGRYRLVRVVGTGGMGVVYEADDERSERKVAVKVLRSTLLTSGPFVERLRREARAITALRHPNIVEVLDLDIKPDRAFLAMELLDGVSLGSFLRDAPTLSAQEVAVIGRSLLDALATAHEAGLVHRDVKPDNVFLANVRGATVVKLLDFGLVKSSAEATPLTATGTVLGTWQYMPPEQAHGLPVDGRADVYSTAACLYYALARKRPYQAADMEASMFALSEVPAPPIGKLRPDLDPAFCRLIDRGLDKSPSARPTARALHEALEPFITDALPRPMIGTAPAASEGSVTKLAAVRTVEELEPTTERLDEEPADDDVPPAPSTLDAPVLPTPRVEPTGVDTTAVLPNAPVRPAEIIAAKTVPLPRPVASAGAPRSESQVKRRPKRRDPRIGIVVVLALLLFVVGVVVGRTFIFR